MENFSLKKFHLDFNVREYNAKDIIENFSEIKTLKIRLNGKNEEKINEDVITLFSYFIPEFFPSCIQFDFDFNIIPINSLDFFKDIKCKSEQELEELYNELNKK